MITLYAVQNPFEPTRRTSHPVDYREGMTLGDAMDAAGIPQRNHACVVDGYAVPEELLAGYPVADGVSVVCMPAVGGAGFGKTFAELAVVVAATVVTGGLAAGPLAALGSTAFGGFLSGIGLGTLSTGMATMVGAGIALGGNMLINAFMGGAGGGGNDSASWDPTGPKTIASGGTPIQKGYGTIRSGGNIIASYVSAEGQQNYLNVLTCHGWGIASSISDIRINNNSISNYSNCTYQVRYGTNVQTPIPYFNNTVNGFPQALRVIAAAGGGTPVVVNGIGTKTQGIQVVMQFPDGVYYQNDDGSLRSLAIAYKIEYSVHGSNNWVVPNLPRTTQNIIIRDVGGVVTYAPTWVVIPRDTGYSSGVVYQWDSGTHSPGDPWTGTQTVTYYNADGSSYTGDISLSGEWQPCDPNLNQQGVVDWNAGYIIFTDSNQGTLYHTTEIFDLPPAQYDIRVTKYGSAFSGDPIQPREANNDRTGDQVWVHSINEVQYQDLAYPNMVLIGVRALATNQLSGANLNISAVISYATNAALPVELAGYGPDNPAVVAYDILTNGLYGAGGKVAPGDIDAAAFGVWASYCDELLSDGQGGTVKRATFNGIFDQSGTNIWKSLQKVAMCGYANIIQIGRKYTVVIDQPAYAPIQVFTVGNIVKDSIKDTWVALDDRANRIEVTFPDAARDYRTDEPCAVMMASDIQAGIETKVTRVSLLGCTNRAQAWHWAYRKLKQNDLLLLSRSFDVNIEAVACQVGSVIGVQDDVTAWAYGGRIQSGSTSTALVVDRDDLPFSAGNGWTVSIVHPTVERGTATIQSITGNLITFTGSIPSGRLFLMVGPTGTNYVIEGTGTNTATVQSSTGLGIGQVMTFYDEDALDTQPISALSGATLTPAAPFVQTPTADCPWVYGQSAGAFPAKLFTVTNIRKKSDFQVTIDCLEYSAAVETTDTPIINETLGVPDSQAAVTDLNVVEQYAVASSANGGQASVIAVGWRNGPNTVATQIWVARNDPNQPISAESLMATVAGAGTTYTLTAPTGTILEIRAVGVDAAGNTAPFLTAPVATITVQGAGLAPGDVPQLAGTTIPGTGTALTWTAATSAANYEVRYNTDPSNTNWQSALLLYTGNALNWTDPQIRLGCYLVKALTTNAVESINAASWNYLLSPVRLNAVGLAAGQSVAVNLINNSYDAGSNTALIGVECPSQTLYRADGTTVVIPDSKLAFGGLAPATAYYLYLYLQPNTFTLANAQTGMSPDTAATAADSATCSANGNYPAAQMVVTSAGSGSAGSLASKNFPSNYVIPSYSVNVIQPAYPYDDARISSSYPPACALRNTTAYYDTGTTAPVTSITYGGFPTLTTSAASNLYLNWSAQVDGPPGTYTIQLSLDGGSTWTTLLTGQSTQGSTASPLALTSPIPTGQDLSLVRVQCTATGAPPSGNNSDIYLWIGYPMYIE